MIQALLAMLGPELAALLGGGTATGAGVAAGGAGAAGVGDAALAGELGSLLSGPLKTMGEQFNILKTVTQGLSGAVDDVAEKFEKIFDTAKSLNDVPLLSQMAKLSPALGLLYNSVNAYLKIQDLYINMTKESVKTAAAFGMSSKEMDIYLDRQVRLYRDMTQSVRASQQDFDEMMQYVAKSTLKLTDINQNVKAWGDQGSLAEYMIAISKGRSMAFREVASDMENMMTKMGMVGDKQETAATKAVKSYERMNDLSKELHASMPYVRQAIMGALRGQEAGMTNAENRMKDVSESFRMFYKGLFLTGQQGLADEFLGKVNRGFAGMDWGNWSLMAGQGIQAGGLPAALDLVQAWSGGEGKGKLKEMIDRYMGIMQSPLFGNIEMGSWTQLRKSYKDNPQKLEQAANYHLAQVMRTQQMFGLSSIPETERLLELFHDLQSGAGTKTEKDAKEKEVESILAGAKGIQERQMNSLEVIMMNVRGIAIKVLGKEKETRKRMGGLTREEFTAEYIKTKKAQLKPGETWGAEEEKKAALEASGLYFDTGETAARREVNLTRGQTVDIAQRGARGEDTSSAFEGTTPDTGRGPTTSKGISGAFTRTVMGELSTPIPPQATERDRFMATKVDVRYDDIERVIRAVNIAKRPAGLEFYNTKSFDILNSLKLNADVPDVIKQKGPLSADSLDNFYKTVFRDTGTALLLKTENEKLKSIYVAGIGGSDKEGYPTIVIKNPQGDDVPLKALKEEMSRNAFYLFEIATGGKGETKQNIEDLNTTLEQFKKSPAAMADFTTMAKMLGGTADMLGPGFGLLGRGIPAIPAMRQAARQGTLLQVAMNEVVIPGFIANALEMTYGNLPSFLAFALTTGPALRRFMEDKATKDLADAQGRPLKWDRSKGYGSGGGGGPQFGTAVPPPVVPASPPTKESESAPWGKADKLLAKVGAMVNKTVEKIEDKIGDKLGKTPSKVGLVTLSALPPPPTPEQKPVEPQDPLGLGKRLTRVPKMVVAGVYVVGKATAFLGQESSGDPLKAQQSSPN